MFVLDMHGEFTPNIYAGYFIRVGYPKKAIKSYTYWIDTAYPYNKYFNPTQLHHSCNTRKKWSHNNSHIVIWSQLLV